MQDLNYRQTDSEELRDFILNELTDEERSNLGISSDEDLDRVIAESLQMTTRMLSDENFKVLFDSSDVYNDDSDITDAYAAFVENYVYNYKPEATEIDDSIDPSEENIGIMAQDIEKVNPAVVKETPEGVKTVDTGKLALMNAGAIADLARRVAAIEEMLNGR